MKKQEELLKKILPILLDYDYLTIKKAATFLIDNESLLKECLNNVNSIISESYSEKNKLEKIKSNTKSLNSKINLLCDSTTTEAGIILKRIYRAICYTKISIEDLDLLLDKELKMSIKDKITSGSREEYLLNLFSLLPYESINSLQELEYRIKLVLSKDSSQNSLANWSSLIIKEKPIGERNVENNSLSDQGILNMKEK